MVQVQTCTGSSQNQSNLQQSDHISSSNYIIRNPKIPFSQNTAEQKKDLVIISYLCINNKTDEKSHWYGKICKYTSTIFSFLFSDINLNKGRCWPTIKATHMIQLLQRKLCGHHLKDYKMIQYKQNYKRIPKWFKETHPSLTTELFLYFY